MPIVGSVILLVAAIILTMYKPKASEERRLQYIQMIRDRVMGRNAARVRTGKSFAEFSSD